MTTEKQYQPLPEMSSVISYLIQIDQPEPYIQKQQKSTEQLIPTHLTKCVWVTIIIKENRLLFWGDDKGGIRSKKAEAVI